MGLDLQQGATPIYLGPTLTLFLFTNSIANFLIYLINIILTDIDLLINSIPI